VRTKRWIEVEGRFAIGEGGGELLKALDAHGSLAQAARQVGWSYRHAWGYVQRAERVLGVPLVVVRHGRGAKKGSVLTTEARAIITALLAQTHTPEAAS
jgi:molybdate transport system regulatory protein